MNTLTRNSFYAPNTDASLPHQLVMRMKPGGIFIANSCNCGTTLTTTRPEVAGSLAATKAEYAAHAQGVLDDQNCDRDRSAV